jgi:hypothetical protein
LFIVAGMTRRELLVRRCAEGDIEAWQELQLTLVPEILELAGGNRHLKRKRLSRDEDHLSDVKVKTLVRLSREDFTNLREFLKRQQELPATNADDFDTRFKNWLFGAVDFAARARITEYFGRRPKLSSSEAGRPQLSKVDVHSYAGRLDEEPERGFLQTLGMTARLTVAELFTRIEREFTAEEARAMQLYYRAERSFEEIARELALEDAKAADQLIRKLNARLRYRVAKQDAEVESA